MKLVSLREKPATEADIGKTVYIAHGKLKIKHIEKFRRKLYMSFEETSVTYQEGDWNLLYWQKPVLISSEEKEAKNKLLKQAEFLIKSNKACFGNFCKECPDGCQEQNWLSEFGEVCGE